MRLAIINPTGGGLSGGYKKYLEEMIPRFDKNQLIESILCAVPKHAHISSSDLLKTKIIECPPFGLFRNRDIRFLNNELEIFSPSLIYVPIERKFKYKNLPVVNMIQNMEPFVKRIELNSLKINLKLMVQRKIGLNALKSSNGIICLSNFVSEFISETKGLNYLNKKLIYHGVNESIPHKSQKPKTINLINENFIFSAGSIRPARGIEDLILSMKILNKNKRKFKLIFAGKVNPDTSYYYNYLNAMINKNKLNNSIKFLGQLNKNEMAWCYEHSKVFVMTSRVESFGMIAGEAMSNGSICISSKSKCLPEIFGDCALYYNSGDYQDLAKKIEKILKFEPDKIKAQRNKARARSNLFSWDICADRTAIFFYNILNEA